MCKASSQEKAGYANLEKISGLMTQQFQKFAGTNSSILDSITGALKPITTAGPSQFGLSPAEEAAERTMTAEQMSQAGAEASNAVRGALASKGGGGTLLPSGSEASILASLAQDNSVKEAMAQANITKQGYDIGRENWKFATQDLSRAPGELENPVTQAGEGATGAGKDQFAAGQAITQANQAWMAPVAGLVGAGIKAATGIPLPSGGGSFPGQSGVSSEGPGEGGVG